jgi:hypothetical protein
MAVGPDGALYIADGGDQRIKGTQNFNGDGIPATRANLTAPDHVAVDSAGNLIVAEEYRIRRVEASTGTITTVVGNGLPPTSAAGEWPRAMSMTANSPVTLGGLIAACLLN